MTSSIKPEELKGAKFDTTQKHIWLMVQNYNFNKR